LRDVPGPYFQKMTAGPLYVYPFSFVRLMFSELVVCLPGMGMQCNDNAEALCESRFRTGLGIYRIPFSRIMPFNHLSIAKPRSAKMSRSPQLTRKKFALLS